MRNPFKRDKVRPHDCRDFLPRGDSCPEGTEARCAGCGAISVRYDYDADWNEGTATFCGWSRTGVVVTDRELELTAEVERLQARVAELEAEATRPKTIRSRLGV